MIRYGVRGHQRSLDDFEDFGLNTHVVTLTEIGKLGEEQVWGQVPLWPNKFERPGSHPSRAVQ